MYGIPTYVEVTDLVFTKKYDYRTIGSAERGEDSYFSYIVVFIGKNSSSL